MMPRIPEGEKGFQFVVSTLVEPTKTINSTKQRLKHMTTKLNRADVLAPFNKTNEHNTIISGASSEIVKSEVCILFMSETVALIVVLFINGDADADVDTDADADEKGKGNAYNRVGNGKSINRKNSITYCSHALATAAAETPYSKVKFHPINHATPSPNDA